MPIHSWTWSTSESLPSVRGVSRGLVNEVHSQLLSHGWTEHEAFGARLALEEALINAMLHGNGGDSRKLVRFDCKLSSRRLWLQITDQGTGFNPSHVPDCTQPENLETPGGRGILLMRTFMNRVEYNAAGNQVVMEKHRDTTPAA